MFQLLESLAVILWFVSDLNFLKGLFDVFPFASEDREAQTAIWSIISRILTVLQEREMTPAILNFLVSILASKLDLIEDELLAHPSDHEEQSTSDTSGAKIDARLISVSFFITNGGKLF